MTDLPVWLQEIRDRVNAATKGPWMLTSSILGDSLVVLANDEETGVLFPSQVVAHIPGGKRAVDTGQFIAAAVDDVPRLVELVGEMAKVLESVVCVFDAMNDVELSLHVGMEAARVRLAARQVLAKFRGEVESND